MKKVYIVLVMILLTGCGILTKEIPDTYIPNDNPEWIESNTDPLALPDALTVFPGKNDSEVKMGAFGDVPVVKKDNKEYIGRTCAECGFITTKKWPLYETYEKDYSGNIKKVVICPNCHFRYYPGSDRSFRGYESHCPQFEAFKLTKIACKCGTDFFVGYDDDSCIFYECGNRGCELYGKRYLPVAVELSEKENKAK